MTEYLCAECGLEIANGVIVAGDAYCVACGMSAKVIAKAQAAFVAGMVKPTL